MNFDLLANLNKILGRTWVVFLMILIAAPGHGKSSRSELLPFVTNSCSLPRFLQGGDYLDCCFKHDYAYWKGGSMVEKRHADVSLVNCIKKKGAYTFTAGVWETMLTYFGQQNWGSGWNPRRQENSPLTAEENSEIIRVSQKLKMTIPVVESYDSDQKCTSNLVKTMADKTTLNFSEEIICYNLLNTSGVKNAHSIMAYSRECEGYFVYQFKTMEDGKISYESLGGYGMCADKIRNEAKTNSPPVNYFRKTSTTL